MSKRDTSKVIALLIIVATMFVCSKTLFGQTYSGSWDVPTDSLYFEAKRTPRYLIEDYGYRPGAAYYPVIPGPPPAWALAYQRATVMKSQFYSQFYRQQANMSWLVYRRADHRRRKLEMIRSRQR